MPFRSERNRNRNRSNRKNRKPHRISNIFVKTENRMLKNGKYANRNEHLNRETDVFLHEFTRSPLVIKTDYQRKRKFMLLAIKTSHRCLASRSRFLHGFKMFLSINSVYIGKFDFSTGILNSNKQSQTLSFSKLKYRNNKKFNGRQMPSVFEVP